MSHNSLFTRTILSQPPTPSPSLYPLLQLGEEEDGDKKKRIQLLEDSIRSQEEMVSVSHFNKYRYRDSCGIKAVI